MAEVVARDLRSESSSMVVSMSSSGQFRRSHNPLVALILAHVALLFLSIYAMAMNLQNYPWPRWQSMFIEVVALSQISLLSCWCILGHSHWGVRSSLLAIGVTFWVVTLRACALNHERWLTIALAQVAGICLMLLAMRFRGYTLVDLKAGKVASDDPPEKTFKLRRFSLFQLFVFVTIGTLILGISQILLSNDAPATLNRGDHIRAPGLALAVAILAVTMLWATLFVKTSSKSSLYSVLLVLFVLICAGWGVGSLDQTFRTSWWSSLGPQAYAQAYWMLLAFYTLLVFLTLLVVRSVGYRIEKVPA